MSSAVVVGDQIVTAYLHDASSRVRIYGLDGRPGPNAALPGLDSVTSISGGPKDTTAYYRFESFISPPKVVAAAIPQVGVLDMLRYHQFTIGGAWAKDYGRSDESPEMFRYLLSYSPVHNVRLGVTYPATLITTAERDDRVVPAHGLQPSRLVAVDLADRGTLVCIARAGADPWDR